MKFEPDNEIGQQLKKNLMQKIASDFNKGEEDALDIADYIIFLIVAKKAKQAIVDEVQDTADVIISVEFIDLVYNEIAKLEQQHELQAAGGAQQQQQQQQQQQPQVTLSTGQIPTGPKRQLTEEEKFELRQQRFGGVTSGPKAHGRGGISKNRTNGHHQQNNKQFTNAKRLEKVFNAAGGKNGALKFVPQPPKGRCPDFPYCKNKECEKAHPSRNCFLYPDCPNPPGTCNYLHPDQDQELIAKLEKSKKEYEERRKNHLMVQQGSCKYGMKCAKQNCPFAHPTPANPEAKIETLEWCAQGKECQNRDCTKSHPPPPTATAATTESLLSSTDLSLEQCKFGSQCTNIKCPRRHATSAVPCRAGAECRRLDCTFAHPIKEPCRFGIKCTNKSCMYQHPEGRSLPSNTWTKDSAATTSTTSVFQSEDQVMEQAAQ
ncbi:Nuclear polyadenylated RNA-binding protein NAB2 [Candida viswanathii]|uniref:Nuclear polyadenylated RNA-binding protein NAB2 n=1 Tax=Candida viswanathii TaxID=5486 RepID=A0A367Y414_9ASCO|nr:Nuclear polyadenylated RNA-binding protein NAB2 [Candida viswanathii]